MALIFGVIVIAIASALAIRLFRDHGIACLHGWFLAISVSFLNIGYVLKYVQRNPRFGEVEAEGLIVVTVGLLTAVAVIVLFHDGIGKFSEDGGGAPRVASGLFDRGSVDRSTSFRLIFLTVCVLGPAWLYFYFIGSVPLFAGIGDVLNNGLSGLGTLQQSRLARDPYVNADAAYIPMQGLLETFRNFGSPLVFSYALICKLRGVNGRLPVLVMALAVVTSLGAGQRWPLMYLLLAGIVTLGLYSRTISRKLVTRFVLVGLAAGVVLSALQARTASDLGSFLGATVFGIGNLLERIFLGQVEVPSQSYGPAGEVFRGMGGESYLMSARSYLPGPGESFPVVFHQQITGSARGFTATPDLYTEAYLNFGLFAVILVTGLLVFALTLIDFWRVADPALASIKATVVTVMAFTSYRSVIAQASVVLPVMVAGFVFLVSAIDIARKRPGVRAAKGGAPPRRVLSR